ncbi:hypothetical protein ASPACDRAFT_62076 [Aspergillus aculeatus ATCC 16872]|uniref:Protein kinase domain-containing protein n=1 Tax=Aspergillus aculeatus (strain ATCC 16872 / CBS 172.66 / WB 5094) TaxID=690307 RepID=A0A1L9WNR9_ASPA1|nr:uncharacterized protein ASPACDRAFT_62076 [Aspergillus aculeatus ATCC 16872]OJJ97796.1 hypothetical protein ASPACDRAFT_62076 [Aspergillus aculeatus ATCC 16872]
MCTEHPKRLHFSTSSTQRSTSPTSTAQAPLFPNLQPKRHPELASLIPRGWNCGAQIPTANSTSKFGVGDFVISSFSELNDGGHSRLIMHQSAIGTTHDQVTYLEGYKASTRKVAYEARYSSNGHIADQGTLRTTYIGVTFACNKSLNPSSGIDSEFFLVWDVPERLTTSDGEKTKGAGKEGSPIRTFLHQCTDLYIARSFHDLVRLVYPYLEVIFTAELRRPRPQTLDAYLARTHLAFRMLPDPKNENAARVEPCPCPCPDHRESVDWNEMMATSRAQQVMAEVPLFAFSDVEDFRGLHHHRVFAVTINGITLIYKPARDNACLVDEAEMLRKVAALPSGGVLRVPKLEGILGAGTPYAGIIMTYIHPGTPLWDLVESGRVEDPAECQKWMGQISNAVQALHQNGCYLGDLQPGNVVIDGKRDAWLIDFEGIRGERPEQFPADDPETADLRDLAYMTAYLEMHGRKAREAVRPGRRFRIWFGRLRRRLSCPFFRQHFLVPFSLLVALLLGHCLGLWTGLSSRLFANLPTLLCALFCIRLSAFLFSRVF